MSRLTLALVLALSACGGSLKNVIDDNVLASLTPQERAGVSAARDGQNRAEDELRSAQVQEKQIASELSLAENEYKSAKLAKDSAKLNRQAAEQSGDFNRKNKAERDFSAAEKNQDAAEAKVDWLDRKKDWAEATREAAEAHVAVIKSVIELEKAKLCVAKNIRPSEKFNMMEFEQQHVQKEQKYNDARREADEKKAKADDKERRFLTAKQTADAAKIAAQ